MTDREGSDRSEVEHLRGQVERLNAELARYKGETGDQRTIHGLKAVVVQVDDDRRVCYVNHSYEEWFGRGRDHVLGLKLQDLEHGRGLGQALLFALNQAVREGGVSYTEFNVRDREGGLRYLRMTATVLERGGGEFFIEDQSQYKVLESTFQRCVSPKIIEELVNNRYNPNVARRQVVTVLFADLRGFTQICTRTEPLVVKQLVDEFAATHMRIVIDRDATVDKIIGDEIMALFGAPLPVEDHAMRAIETALAMQDAHATLVENWRLRGLPTPPLGIGMSSGEVIAGAIGSEVQLSYTVLGHHVNLASRLCGAARGGQVLASPETFDLAREWIASHPMAVNRPVKFKRGPDLQVKGVDAPVATIAVIHG